ncbi:hypothetical protein QTO34_014387 [Cnephaeus nilssonii]|uniref:Uncharacterized protein n=1 Tax=Cnephaeus nilssonii TaxID=3371016 RepID=A0AA40I697_CNENI|nr:hypothetical protein QTO34_014387 [Eptesicus nilssonii]
MYSSKHSLSSYFFQPRTEKQFIKKVTLLIQFLIEIVVKYWEQKSLPSLERFHLENGLNVDVDVPCSDLVKNLGRGNRIMDSVLTISDDDLEQPEEGKGIETSMREKHRSAASCTPPTGDVSTTKVHALDQNRTWDLSVRRLTLYPLSQTSFGEVDGLLTLT